MKISVLGAGNAGCAIAADLASRNHDVTLIKTSKSMHEDNFDYLEKSNGAISMLEDGEVSHVNITKVTRDVSAVSGSDVIIIYIQTNYHEDLIKRICPFLKNGQIVLMNPGYLSTAYMLEHMGDKDIVIAEAESSFIDCRISEPGSINVAFRNVRNPIGIYPVEKADYAKEKLEKLGFPFTYVSSVVEAALHNPNLIIHTVGAVMSIPRIEKTGGDYCMYYEVFTPSVWNILERLDGEKMDVLEHLGFSRVPYVEACKFRNSLDDSRDAKEVFFWYASMPTCVKGPIVVDSRYITEDVSQGLVMLESLGTQLNIKTPICTALIEMASAALGRDMREGGRTPDRLGKDNVKRILDNCGRGLSPSKS